MIGHTAGMWYDSFDTPIGPLTVATDVEGLRHVLFETNRHEVHGRSAWLHSPGRLAEARRQLLEYFAGERRAFELPLRPAGTAFLTSASKVGKIEALAGAGLTIVERSAYLGGAGS